MFFAPVMKNKIKIKKKYVKEDGFDFPQLCILKDWSFHSQVSMEQIRN